MVPAEVEAEVNLVDALSEIAQDNLTAKLVDLKAGLVEAVYMIICHGIISV